MAKLSLKQQAANGNIKETWSKLDTYITATYGGMAGLKVAVLDTEDPIAEALLDARRALYKAMADLDLLSWT